MSGFAAGRSNGRMEIHSDAISRWQPLRMGLSWVLLGVLPAFLLVEFLAVAGHSGSREQVDFHVFFTAAGAVAHGHDPYPAHVGALSWAGPGLAQRAYAYPPPVAILIAPLSLLSYHAAATIWALGLASAVGIALWLLDVRDWRCYGAVFLWPTTLTAISVGTISPLLLLGVAAVWRLRNRPAGAATAAAVTIAAKLFLWPILPWLWLTGRRVAAVGALLIAVVASLLTWWWIGFAGFWSYPALLGRLTAVEAPEGYAPAWHAAGYAGLGVTAVACLAALWFVRRSERTALRAAVPIALVLTPILWLHYLVLLAVALTRRFSWLWLLPVLLWFTPQQGAYGDAWRIVPVGAVIALIALSARRLDPVEESAGVYRVPRGVELARAEPAS